ncbi:MAG: DUF3108 domain-containing protein [Stappiaceae bacterium]
MLFSIGCVTRIVGIMAAVGSAILVPTSLKAENGSIGALYDVSIAGFGFARASLSLVVNENRYSATISTQPAGVGTLVTAGKGTAKASGYLNGKTVLPSRYNMNSSSDNKRSYVKMKVGEGRLKTLNVAPKLRPFKDRIAVTAKHHSDIVDPVSAILMPLENSSASFGPQACDRRIPIFDGWTRYDIQLSYKRRKKVRGFGYDGDVIICSARWVPVAGHRPAKKSVQYMAANTDMEIWLAPLAGTRVLFPYRASMRTAAGKLIVLARKINMSAAPSRVQAAK